ncbi:MAG: hypothetical protein JXA33_20145 [Anaerolineae bacterium]|nr:hypothetical protein [Anaerolineae bacterium]
MSEKIEYTQQIEESEYGQSNDLVYALARIPLRNEFYCFAARTSGLYLSTNGGQTWETAYRSLALEDPLPTTSVVFSSDSETEYSVFAGVPGGVLRASSASFDHGKAEVNGVDTDTRTTVQLQWEIAGFGSPPPMVSSLVISPDFARDGILLAGTMEDGIYRSADRGNRWVAWNFGLLDLNVITLAISPNFTEDETLFAGVESGMFRSTNGGRAWREVDLPTGFTSVISLAFSPNYAQDGVIFAGTEEQGLLLSKDWGKTWRVMKVAGLTGPVNGIVLDPDVRARANAAFTPQMLVIVDGKLFVSRDGAQTWLSWPTEVQDITTVIAPEGLEPGSRLLAGLFGGDVVWI